MRIQAFFGQIRAILCQIRAILGQIRTILDQIRAMVGQIRGWFVFGIWLTGSSISAWVEFQVGNPAQYLHKKLGTQIKRTTELKL